MKDYQVTNVESFVNLWNAKNGLGSWMDLAADPDVRIRQCVAGRKDCPTETLQILADDPEVSVRRQLARNPTTSLDALERLATDVDPKVRTGVASHRNASLAILRKLAEEGVLEIDTYIAQNQNTPASVLAGYAVHADPMVRARAASNQNLEPDDLWRFANDVSGDVRRIACARLLRLDQPGKAAAFFVGDKDRRIRFDIASDVKTDDKILRVLSNDEYNFVGCAVARNPNTPEEILEHLASDENEHVRHTVATVTSTNLHRLARLAKDQHDHVRVGVARNELTPFCILAELARDESEWVREAVAMNQSLKVTDLENLFGNDPVDRKVRHALRTHRIPRHNNVIIQDPEASAEALIEVINSDPENTYYGMAIAERPDLPVEVIEALASLRSFPVAIRLVVRSDIPENLRSELLRDIEVRKWLAYSRSIQSEIIDHLCSTEKNLEVIRLLARNSNVAVEYLAKIENHADDQVRLNVAGNPNTSASTLRRLSQDQVECIRKATATNPNTPVDALENLTNDESEIVRLELIKNGRLTPRAVRQLAADTSRAVRRSLVLSILSI